MRSTAEFLRPRLRLKRDQSVEMWPLVSGFSFVVLLSSFRRGTATRPGELSSVCLRLDDDLLYLLPFASFVFPWICLFRLVLCERVSSKLTVKSLEESSALAWSWSRLCWVWNSWCCLSSWSSWLRSCSLATPVFSFGSVPSSEKGVFWKKNTTKTRSKVGRNTKLIFVQSWSKKITVFWHQSHTQTPTNGNWNLVILTNLLVSLEHFSHQCSLSAFLSAETVPSGFIYPATWLSFVLFFWPDQKIVELIVLKEMWSSSLEAFALVEKKMWTTGFIYLCLWLEGNCWNFKKSHGPNLSFRQTGKTEQNANGLLSQVVFLFDVILDSSWLKTMQLQVIALILQINLHCVCVAILFAKDLQANLLLVDQFRLYGTDLLEMPCHTCVLWIFFCQKRICKSSRNAYWFVRYTQLFPKKLLRSPLLSQISVLSRYHLLSDNLDNLTTRPKEGMSNHLHPILGCNILLGMPEPSWLQIPSTTTQNPLMISKMNHHWWKVWIGFSLMSCSPILRTKKNPRPSAKWEYHKGPCTPPVCCLSGTGAARCSLPSQQCTVVMHICATMTVKTNYVVLFPVFLGRARL